MKERTQFIIACVVGTVLFGGGAYAYLGPAVPEIIAASLTGFMAGFGLVFGRNS